MPKLSNTLPCLHCLTRVGSYCRGLCKGCFDTPGVRDVYPVRRIAAMNRCGCGLYVSGMVRPGGRQVPPEATTARPGSEEKILVLCERASLGQVLWHPDDNSCSVKRLDPDRLEEMPNFGRKREEEEDGEE